MKPSDTPWFELSSVVAGLLVVMLGVMWMDRPDASCTLSFEPPRVLVLTRETDREHLATDLATADRMARRYMLSTEDATEQGSRFLECEAKLRGQIAARHSLSPEQVRTSLPDR